MARKHAKVTFRAGQIDLIDLARKQEFFGRNQTQLEGRHHALRWLNNTFTGLAGGVRRRWPAGLQTMLRNIRHTTQAPRYSLNGRFPAP
jgi:hypothetical protein